MDDTTDIDDDGVVDFDSDTGDIDSGAEPESYYFGDYTDDASQAKAFHEFAQSYGGDINAIKEALNYQRELHEKYSSDPRAQAAYQAWWNGQYQQNGQQQQQQQRQAPQQPQLPKGLEFLKYTENPGLAAAHQAALMNGGVIPEGYQNRDQYQQQLLEIQSYHDNNFLNPIGARLSELDHPKIQEKIIEIARSVTKDIEGRLKEQSDRELVSRYSEQLNAMHPEVKAMFKAGQWGTGERAAQAALRMDALIKGQQQQQQPQRNGQQQRQPKQEDKPKAPSKNGPPKTALERVEQVRRANSSAFGRAMGKAVNARLNGKD